MDDLVKAAMVKWPNVPDCYGWLGLDARGQWWLRDEQAQRAGAFAGTEPNAAAKGFVLAHEKLLQFIQRNYSCDAQGCWFFQNGPQRVYVELECAPWVLRMDVAQGFTNQCGEALEPRAVLADERGRCYVATNKGLGVLHSMDMHLMGDAIERGTWAVEEVVFDELPKRFGYVLSPSSCLT